MDDQTLEQIAPSLIAATGPDPIAVATGQVIPDQAEHLRKMQAQMQQLLNRPPDLSKISDEEGVGRIGPPTGGLSSWETIKREGPAAVGAIALNALLGRIGVPPTAAGAITGATIPLAQDFMAGKIPAEGARTLLKMGFGAALGGGAGALEGMTLKANRNLATGEKYTADKAAYTAAQQSRNRAGRAANATSEKLINDLAGRSEAEWQKAQALGNPEPPRILWGPAQDAYEGMKQAAIGQAERAKATEALTNSASQAFQGDPKKFLNFLNLTETKTMLRRLYPNVTDFDERHAALAKFLEHAQRPLGPEPTAPALESSMKHKMTGDGTSYFIGHLLSSPKTTLLSMIPTHKIIEKFMTASPGFRRAATEWAETGLIRSGAGYGGSAFANWVMENKIAGKSRVPSGGEDLEQVAPTLMRDLKP